MFFWCALPFKHPLSSSSKPFLFTWVTVFVISMELGTAQYETKPSRKHYSKTSIHSSTWIHFNRAWSLSPLGSLILFGRLEKLCSPWLGLSSLTVNGLLYRVGRAAGACLNCLFLVLNPSPSSWLPLLPPGSGGEDEARLPAHSSWMTLSGKWDVGQNEFLLALLNCAWFFTFHGVGIQGRGGREFCLETGGVLSVSLVMMEFVSRGRRAESPGINSFLAVGR